MTTTSSWTPAEAREVLEQFESSGLSVAEFARQHGIAAHRLYWARRRARDERKLEASSVEAGFNEVVVRDHAVRHAAPIELRLPTGISIRVTRDFDEVALRRLLGVLVSC